MGLPSYLPLGVRRLHLATLVDVLRVLSKSSTPFRIQSTVRLLIRNRGGGDPKGATLLGNRHYRTTRPRGATARDRQRSVWWCRSQKGLTVGVGTPLNEIAREICFEGAIFALRARWSTDGSTARAHDMDSILTAVDKILKAASEAYGGG